MASTLTLPYHPFRLTPVNRSCQSFARTNHPRRYHPFALSSVVCFSLVNRFRRPSSRMLFLHCLSLPLKGLSQLLKQRSLLASRDNLHLRPAWPRTQLALRRMGDIFPHVSSMLHGFCAHTSTWAVPNLLAVSATRFGQGSVFSVFRWRAAACWYFLGGSSYHL